MKLVQVKEYNTWNIFLQKSGKNEAGRLVPGIFLFLQKLNMRKKQVERSLGGSSIFR